MSLSHEFIVIQSGQFDELISLKAMYGDDVRFDRFDKIPWPTGSYAAKIEYELDLLMEYYKKCRHNCISISDAYILSNISAFECVDTLMSGFIPYRGLNYYGFTLIPWENIPCFLDTLHKLPDNNSFTQLIEFSEKAISLHHNILHCGI